MLGYDLLFGFTLGNIIAAVSLAVVIPGMIDLKNRNIGNNKGITTIILGAASFDDILTITKDIILMSLIFPTSGDNATIFNLFFTDDVLLFLQPILKVVLGILPGWALGNVIGYFTNGINCDILTRLSVIVFIPIIVLII